MIRYAITDRGYAGSVDAAAARWLDAGVNVVQLRDKTMEAGDLAHYARRIMTDLAGLPEPGEKIPLLVNGRADVAAAVGAAGVHLSAHPDELTPAQVRRVFALARRPEPVISVSCHTLAEVERARDANVDLILFGPVFEKRVTGEHVAAGVGLEALRQACAAAGQTKVLALGGVTAENAAACVEAGAAGIAAIRLFSKL
jgi:thiamine-phosphate pyrophosphorylase